MQSVDFGSPDFSPYLASQFSDIAEALKTLPNSQGLAARFQEYGQTVLNAWTKALPAGERIGVSSTGRRLYTDLDNYLKNTMPTASGFPPPISIPGGLPTSLPTFNPGSLPSGLPQWVHDAAGAYQTGAGVYNALFGGGPGTGGSAGGAEGIYAGLTEAQIAQMAADLQAAYGQSAQGNAVGPNLPTYLDPNGASPIGMGLPAILKPSQTTRLRSPKGYVTVLVPNGHPGYTDAINAGGIITAQGVKISMMKEVARKFKLWKPRPKPLLSSSDMRTIRKANSLKRKVARAAKSAGIQGCRTPRKR